MKNWLKKLQIKGFVAGVLVAVLFSGTLLVVAQTVSREITYGVRVNLDGQILQFAEDMRPFAMEGRTFLPVRALADALGLPVGFDPSTNTVYLIGRSTLIVDGVAIEHFLGVRTFELIQALGSPQYGVNHHVGALYSYNNMSFIVATYFHEFEDRVHFGTYVSSGSEAVLGVNITNPSVAVLNGHNLNMNRVQIIDTFGTPTSEYVSEASGELWISYENVGGLRVDFVLGTPRDSANRVMVSRSNH